jgi:hypothetical protein
MLFCHPNLQGNHWQFAFQTWEKLRQGLIVEDHWSPKDGVMQDE